MLKTRRVSDSVLYADEMPVVVGADDVEAVKAMVPGSALGRARLCAHRDPAAALQEMLIVLDPGTYIRPAKHLGKAESLLVLEGEADAVFFDEAGEIVDVVRLTPYADGGNFYYQIDEPVYHTLRVRSDSFVFHESTTGPFDPAATTPAPWAPAEGDEAAVRDYLAALDTRLIDRSTDA